MSKIVSSAVLVALGAGLGVAVQQWWPATQQDVAASAEKAPLYWVAPMDPNYRRDQPGKSPMGMDLIPVYEEEGNQDSPGTVRISPEVVQNLGVRTQAVQRQPLSRQIDTVGYIGYDEDRLVHVHPRVEGWVERLYVKAEGDPVQKGQPLYEIYSPQLVSAQEEYLIALGRGNSQMITSVERRLKALQVSRQEIARLKKTREVRQSTTIYAPADGYVDNLSVREGNYIKPGNELMLIGPLDQVWLLAEVFERQAAGVKVGDPVTMELDFLPGEKWQGEVDFIYPLLDQQTRTLKVRVRFDNPGERLKPNMFARVQIRTQGDEPQLAVPREAVIRSGGMERVVLALGEGRFKSVKVITGQQAGEMVAIRDGLNEGDQVVISAQFLLDSESSISSDFRRMSVPDATVPQEDHSQMDHSQMDHGAVMPQMDHGQMDHGAVMPPMDHSQMDHGQMDHGAVMAPMDHSQMDHGQMDHDAAMAPMDHSKMDHGQMDHGVAMAQMDHSQMDHGQMDHDAAMAQMDHSQMDHGQMDHDAAMAQMDHSQMDHGLMDHSQMNHAAMESGEGRHD